MTGIFSQEWVGSLDGSYVPGGLITGNAKQLGYQVAACLVIAAWSFAITFTLLSLINWLPGMGLYHSAPFHCGNDLSQTGERAYDYLLHYSRYEEERKMVTVESAMTVRETV
jgi:Amt family ammonium transporter